MINRTGDHKKIVNWSLNVSSNVSMPRLMIMVLGFDEFSRAFCCQKASKMAKPILANT